MNLIHCNYLTEINLKRNLNVKICNFVISLPENINIANYYYYYHDYYYYYYYIICSIGVSLTNTKHTRGFKIRLSAPGKINFRFPSNMFADPSQPNRTFGCFCNS